jgi:protein-S-isoprenylcysteine O-methyltransferase Ste14
MNIEPDSAQVRFPPPFVYLGFLLIGFGAERFVGLRSLGLDRTLGLGLGTLLFLAGTATGLAATSRFRRAGTDVKPWRASTEIVESGPFRWTRNPMYLGMALIYAGLAIALDGPIALILLPVLIVIIQTQVITREERYLEGKFGKPYLDYKARVRRWF